MAYIVSVYTPADAATTLRSRRTGGGSYLTLRHSWQLARRTLSQPRTQALRATPEARYRRGNRISVQIPDALHLAEPSKTIEGEDYDFAATKGKVVLAVNVASQDTDAAAKFAVLVDLHNRYREAGLEVLLYPSNWYGQREPGSDEEIAERIRQFGGSYTVMSKLANFDMEANQVFELAIARFPGEIVWNFHGKFLFDRNGIPVARFELLTPAEEIEEKIREYI